MENILHLSNDKLDVHIRLPGSKPESERFDSCGQVKQVILNGKHRFCQPEQLKEDRVTCYGFGLCSEFDMNMAAAGVRTGEKFPKPGVGLLTQIQDGLPYDMWSHYEIDRFEKTWRHGRDWVEFEEKPVPCMGIAARILKRLSLMENTLTVSTTVINEGTQELDFSEYQHNFVAIDDLPVDKGYCLELPYDGSAERLPQCFRNLKDFSSTEISCVEVEDKKIRWVRSMDGFTYHKTTQAEEIIPQGQYRWTLSHENSAARVSEISHFHPCKIVLWGIEHCICAEVYNRIVVKPGESHHFARTWVFEDEQTHS